MVSNVEVSRPFVLLKESLAFDIQTRCVDWPTATGDGSSSSTENCSLEALVSLLDWDAARRNGYNTSLQLATEQVPVGFTEVPALLGWAVDNRQLESYVDEQWSMLTMREVSQHRLASWLGVVTDRCYPTQVRWVVLLPSCRIECTTLLGIMGQSEITVGCPFHQSLSILVRFWVAPLRVMAIEVAHVCCGMHKSWKHTLVPVLTGRFVNIGNSESSNLNNVTEVWWRDGEASATSQRTYVARPNLASGVDEIRSNPPMV